MNALAAAVSTLIAFGGSSSQPATVRQVPVTATGQIAVTFHGDPGTGCEAAGLCDVEGTALLVVPRRGDFAIIRSSARRYVFLSLGDFESGGGYMVRTRRGEHTCTDASGASSGGGAQVKGTRVTVALRQPGEALFASRCAGPLDRDLAAALPHPSVALSRLSRGRTTLDLSGEQGFAAGGLAGTVTSTVKLRLGRPAKQTGSAPKVRARHRLRYVNVRYRLARMAGSIQVSATPLADPFPCAAIDACGLSSTVTIAPVLARGEFFTASRNGGTPGGGGTWTGRGTTTADVARADGPACRSEAPFAGGQLAMEVVGREAEFSWLATPETLRTRCPGPVAADFGGANTLARGRLPLSALAKPRSIVRLTGSGPFTGAGYAGQASGEVTVELRRGRVTRQTIRVP